jgi:transaldolase/glucose-6-phosphate isomerase
MNKNNPVAALRQYGQSVWLDFLKRTLMTSGELKRLIEDDGVLGMTSNPAIFEKAITGSADYDTALAEIAREGKRLTPMEVYERLAIPDIQSAADILKPTWEKTNKRDGYVSLEVSPYVAEDAEATLKEARHLWKEVGRPNVMIKVPGTPAGLKAFRSMIAEGINTNVTLLFANDAYETFAWTYLDGLEERAKKGLSLDNVASVASFFVSRIDSVADTQLQEKIKGGAKVEGLLGKVAIANARVAYETYLKVIADPRWKALAGKGAMPQRVLWASTGTKNPAYKDVLYVEELIGEDTVNTMPPETLAAFRHHGQLREALKSGIAEAHQTLAALKDAGVSLDKITAGLLIDGVKKFSEPFTKLLDSIEKRYNESASPRVNPASQALPAALATEVQKTVEAWGKNGSMKKLWDGDASLWTGADEASWLGWLKIVDQQLADLEPLLKLQTEAKGFKNLLLLGMGGSSLGPEVWKETFGVIPGFPELFVLDSTDPAQLKAFEDKIDLEKTLFIVASKSGSTLEPSIFKAYFFDRVKAKLGAEAGSRFIAVTDPGSNLEKEAKGDKFRHIFAGVKQIGGRYSVLSNFGMVPAAAMGLDVKRLLEGAKQMLTACGPQTAAAENPGLALGALLGVGAGQKVDKLTLVASPAIYDLGAWLEQLIAESTGKEGQGIVPIDREKLGSPAVYGNDRLFVYLRLAAKPDATQDDAVLALEKAGKPVVRIEIATKYDLSQEMARWEIATAVAGAVMKINPFNQPDVEASKIATKALTSEYEKTGKLPAETAFYDGEGVKLFADPANEQALKKAVEGGNPSLVAYLKAHLARATAGDYFALLAYLPMNANHEEVLQIGRHLVREHKKVATCLEFGPRFLHSSGQLYKGGPNTALVLQLTCDDAKDLQVPGSKYTFGTVKAAQARGDFTVLSDRKRRALRIHLGADVSLGLKTLNGALAKALT